jgi:hypothetical protein
VLPSSARTLRGCDFLQDVHDRAKSALSAAATRVVNAADQAESAINSAAITLQGIKEDLPQNCSLSTKRFCIGYRHESNCSNLPLDLSSLLPESVYELLASIEDAIRD